jgi:thiamine-phosphate diphosphorylase
MSIRNHFDLSAYLVIGPENTKGRSVADTVAAALRGGFTLVQIRSKEASARELIELLRQAANVIAAQNRSDTVALVADDRLDVVWAARQMGIKVDGIHVGQSDIPANMCRELLGEDAIVGLSAPTPDLFNYIRRADVSGIDYFGAGPVHETATKPDCGLGADGKVITRTFDDIKRIAELSPLPVVVGGGVKLADIPPLAKTGVDGFFVVSAVSEAKNPELAASELVQTWKQNQ